MKVLVFGSINIDLLFSVDHIVRPGETVSGLSFKRSAGGKGANQAAALAKAGAEVYFAGKIGEDGEFLADLLGSYGVHTRFISRYPGPTGQALIQLDREKQNAIVLLAGGNGALDAAEVPPVLEAFEQGDWLLVQNEIPLSGLIMEAAKKRGLKICLNPSPCDGRVEALPLDLADLFLVNELEGAALAGLPPESPLPGILDRLTARFPRSEVILTAGKAGAFYGSGSLRSEGSIVDLPVVDTTGAGDTFTGYYLAARLRAFPPAEALRLACKAASIAVSRPGAMEAIPLAGEVFD